MSSTRQTCLARVAVIVILAIGIAGFAWAQDRSSSSQVQRTGKTPPSQVGSAMAVLATLEQAQVLPPENTPEANQVIKSVIQFQSAFAKSEDRSLQKFAARALTGKYGKQAAYMIAQFRSTGWTANLLEALADAESQSSAEEIQALATGFNQFNLSTNDFHRFMLLVREARASLETRGSNFQQVFASHRQAMPGGNPLR